MISLTILGILLVALLAHWSGARSAGEGARLSAFLESRTMVVAVFIITMGTLWYAWAAWNPIPVIHDELAYVFQAQLFARGKWALPAPPFPAFWEQRHLLIEPVVTSKYFPGNSLVLSLGALAGWMPLMPLLLQGCVAALLFVLARRVSSGAVALLTWVIWLFTPMVLFFGPSYFSEGVTTTCWLAGWYALLEWRKSRTLPWLLAVAVLTGWDAITRPLTGLAYAIPIGVIVIRDVIAGRRWRDLALACLAGAAVIAILPLWSAHTTGDWRVTPLALYTRLYMPYDVPGFGLVTTPPAHAQTPDLVAFNRAYISVHATHLPSNLPAIIQDRLLYLSISTWGTTSGLLSVFALLGLITMGSEAAFAFGSSVILILAYLSYATPGRWTVYYFETTPAFTFLSACGLAWAASLIGRPRGVVPAPDFGWRSPRWTRALVAGSLVLTLPGVVALRIMRAQHVADRRDMRRFDVLLGTIHDARAVMFVRYAESHSVHVAFVRNSANPAAERIWVVYDRGEGENARLLATVPDRKAYLFDETRGRTYVYSPREAP